MRVQVKTAWVLILIAGGMLGLGFSSKILYDTFCRVTGYGGTPRIAQANNEKVQARRITIRLDANTAQGLPWKFTPEQESVSVQVGQSVLVYYQATNLSSQAITATATYNVIPIKVAPYFTKMECFCFTEQVLQAGQSLSFPVLFYLDPLLMETSRLDDVNEITLSYTFFETNGHAAQSHAVAGVERLR